MHREAAQQQELPFEPRFGWGGARRGAGRKKPKDGRKGRVPHRRRPELKKRHPLHVTVRLIDGLPSVRTPKALEILKERFRAVLGREEFRLVHYSIQSNHMHLLVEAGGKDALARGMQGLLVRISRGLNRLWCRRGSIFAERYHAVILESPTQVRNAIRYVLNNARRHAARTTTLLDRFASGAWFHRWSRPIPRAASYEPKPISSPKTWLLRTGWWKHAGPTIDPMSTPGRL